MQTRCPNCTSIVKTQDGVTWKIVNGACPELAGTRWKDKPEFCPTLSQIAQPEVALPGLGNREAVVAEIRQIKKAGSA
jgi:hypothetical protein